MERRDLLDLTPQRLAQILAPVDSRPFTTRQVLRWAYNRAADDFALMTDVSKAAREFLARAFTLTPLAEVESLPLDGVVKTLHRLRDGFLVESVLIPEEGHNTLCVSSQAGCAMGCDYCETARGGLDRDLTAGEILAQVAAGIRRGGDRLALRNLVFMGMGEPLANLDAVLPALTRILASDGFDFSPRRVTVSTCGLVPGIGRLGRAHPGVNLAVSLNAADDETRSRLMPVARAYPLKALMAAVRRFPLAGRQRITFAYVLLEGVNDSDRDARLLAALVRGIPCKINLIPYNRTSGGYRRPSPERTERFLQLLVGAGLTVTVREGRGEEIGAACGQLKAGRTGERGLNG
jgi:23S rRNA (adenine2503-C2)-methyltransferase